MLKCHHMPFAKNRSFSMVDVTLIGPVLLHRKFENNDTT